MGSKVLIVDDALFMRKVLEKILVSAGYEVVGEAENGQQAIEKYDELWPDVVLLDITMEGMGGIDAVSGLMSLDPSAKIVMCSALGGQRAMVNEATAAGAKGFIVKPFDAEKVVEEIERVLTE